MSDWDGWVAEHGRAAGRTGRTATAVAVADLTLRFGRAGLRSNDGIVNTLRHTMWSALLSVRFSSGGRVSPQRARELTHSWTEVHELVGDLRSLDTAVDRFNNAAGARIGQQLVADGYGSRSFLTLRGELMRRVVRSAADGELAYWSRTETAMRRTSPADLPPRIQRLLRPR